MPFNVRLKLILLVGLASGALTAGAFAAPTAYTWKTATGNWNDTGKWDPPGYPGTDAGDTASFTNAGYTVNINTNPTFAAFTVTGSGSWIWNRAVNNIDYSVTLGSGLTYSSSGVGSFNPHVGSSGRVQLAGAGGITVNAGRFELSNSKNDNTFSGDIVINGGTLMAFNRGAAGNPAQDCGPGLLGTAATVYLGSTNSGTNAATMLVGGGGANGAAGAIYQPSVVVRAGNSGEAAIGYAYGYQIYEALFTNTVTLQKDLTLRNDYFEEKGTAIARNMVLDRVSGTGVITKKGLGVARGARWEQTGNVVVEGGDLRLNGDTTATFTGSLLVRNGRLLPATDASLGNTGNTITLGTAGTLGGIGCWPATEGALVTIARPIALTGSGGYLYSRNSGRPIFSGTLTGASRLTCLNAANAYLDGNNTYSGGTYVVDGLVDISTSGNYNRTVFGTGNVQIDPNGTVALHGAANMNSGSKVRVDGALRLYADYVPALDTNSSGTLSLYANSGTAIETRLATTAAQLGNGRMVLAGYNATFRGSSLQAGTDGIYRLKGDGAGTLTVDNSSGTTGPLIGANSLATWGTAVALRDANAYSGETRVTGGTLEGTAQATGSPFGHTNGAVTISGAAALKLVGASGGQAVKKGAMTYEGVAVVQVDRTISNYATELEFYSLVRSNKAVLAIQGVRGDLGGNERVKVTSGAPTATDGMIDPAYLDYGGHFLTYGVNGFARATYTKNTLSGAVSTDIVELAGTETPATVTVQALRTAFSLTGANTVTLARNGLILAGGTHTTPFVFPGEGVIFCSADSTLNGALTAANGFIKAGPSVLTLGANNTALAGTITVDQGEVRVSADNQLGSANIYLNGGGLRMSVSTTIDNPIELGPKGGSIASSVNNGTSGSFSGNITGAGGLNLNGTWNTAVSGPGNTFKGGTYVSSGGLTVNAGSSLGTGPLTVGGAGTVVSGHCKAVFKSDGMADDARVTLLSWGSQLYIFSGAVNLSIGSLAGCGFVFFYDDATLTVGGDNTDTEYYGQLGDYGPLSIGGKLVKNGTGTFTLWGENTFGNGTTPGWTRIEGGTLLVNNYLNTAMTVTVTNTGTLGGMGTVGTVAMKNGGTLAPGYNGVGTLYAKGNVTFDAGSTLAIDMTGDTSYDTLDVGGNVSLGGALEVSALGGYRPIDGDRVLITAGGTVSGSFASIPPSSRVSIVGQSVVLKYVPPGTLFSIR